jgi:hypothetical protein
MVVSYECFVVGFKPTEVDQLRKSTYLDPLRKNMTSLKRKTHPSEEI